MNFKYLKKVKKLGIDNPDDLLILNIVNIPQSNPKLATINLLGPIVININNKKAAQLVLNSDKYSVRHKIFQEKTEQQIHKQKSKNKDCKLCWFFREKPEKN